MNVNLSDNLKRFVRSQLRTGRYSTASEVVRDALKLLRDKLREDTETRAAAQVGIDDFERGDYAPWNAEEARALGRKLLAESKRKAASQRGVAKYREYPS